VLPVRRRVLAQEVQLPPVEQEEAVVELASA